MNRGSETPAVPVRVVVFDGTCVLCSSWVAFLLRHPQHRRFRFSTTQSAPGRKLLQAHGVDAENPSSFLLLDGGRAYAESDAAIRMLCALRGVWRASAVGYLMPKPVRDRIYRWLARNRYRWFGRREQCFVPSAADRDLFLV
jgi:predicted DCC family thiol-disulfide oxidoreductase YuxK